MFSTLDKSNHFQFPLKVRVIRSRLYVEIVAGWHEAADGRGLSQLERCRKNYAMLNMILDEWMPWHKEVYDFATIDINRQVYINMTYGFLLSGKVHLGDSL